MVTLKNAASGTAQYIAREVNLDPKETETLRYGMEIIFGILMKGVFIVLISYWLKITPYVLTALVTSSVFRLFSGGVHCSSFGRCLVFGTAMAVLIGKLACTAGPYMNLNLILLFVMLITLFGLYAVNKWAPADSACKPITRDEKRKKFKRLSLVYIVIWTSAITLYLYVYWEGPLTFSLALASLGGLLVQAFSLCPGGYRLVGIVDYVLSKVLP